MRPDEAWEMTPREVHMWIEGLQFRQVQHDEEMAHYTSIIVNNERKRSKQVKPEKLRRLVIDKKKLSRRPDEETAAEIRERDRATARHLEASAPPVRPRKHRSREVSTPSGS